MKASQYKNENFEIKVLTERELMLTREEDDMISQRGKVLHKLKLMEDDLESTMTEVTLSSIKTKS